MKVIIKIIKYFLKRVKKTISNNLFRFKCLIYKNTSIHLSCDLSNTGLMEFGKNIIIEKNCSFTCYPSSKNLKPILIIEEGSYLGRNNSFVAIKKVHIHKNVLFAPNVYISDSMHEYKDITKPIKNQGITGIDEVEIGENSWIGINVCILPGCHIGKNCVIGANSVVTKNFPDFCVIGGCPAKIIKKYNLKTKLWEKPQK